MHMALEGYLSRSGWNVGTPHLSEFMKKLFPDEYAATRDLLDSERKKAEQEEKTAQEEFVPWEPYDKSDPGSDVVEVSSPGGGMVPGQRPVTNPRLRSPATEPDVAQMTTQEGAAQPRSRSWLSLLLVVLLVLLCAAAGVILWQLYEEDKAPAQTPPPATSGTLDTHSEPPGATVFVNGKPRGKTPLKLADLPLGEELTVRFELSGYQDYIQPVKLTTMQATAVVRARMVRE
jgi:hypothetical protein